MNQSYAIRLVDLIPPLDPPRATGSNFANYPIGGYAGKKLRNWKPRMERDSVLASFILDFLEQNGFYDCGAFIRGILQ